MLDFDIIGQINILSPAEFEEFKLAHPEYSEECEFSEMYIEARRLTRGNLGDWDGKMRTLSEKREAHIRKIMAELED